jgi:hypothetical protein
VQQIRDQVFTACCLVGIGNVNHDAAAASANGVGGILHHGHQKVIPEIGHSPRLAICACGGTFVTIVVALKFGIWWRRKYQVGIWPSGEFRTLRQNGESDVSDARPKFFMDTTTQGIRHVPRVNGDKVRDHARNTRGC